MERSTPVNACTAGGTCPTRRVSSPLVASLPPRSTISSVLAKGAAISAAICGGGEMSFFKNETREIRQDSLKSRVYLWQSIQSNIEYRRFAVLLVNRCFHTHTLGFRYSDSFQSVSVCLSEQSDLLGLGSRRTYRLSSAKWTQYI